MNPLALGLIELGAVVFSLGLLARLAGRIGMSPIPLYLLGGLAFGTGGIVELAGMKQSAHLSGRSASFCCCSCWGWNIRRPRFSPDCEDRGRPVLDLVLNFLPGAALALILSWGFVGAVVMGGVTYISSSGIAAKVITDLGWLGNRETRVVISILVLKTWPWSSTFLSSPVFLPAPVSSVDSQRWALPWLW